MENQKPEGRNLVTATMASRRSSINHNFDPDTTLYDHYQPILLDKQENTTRSSLFSRALRCSHDSWVPEYLALSISMACMVAIFSMLFYFHDKALDTWHSSLSIGTVLSILVTTLKGSALLATTSALGQLKWAWYSSSPQPLRHFQIFDYASRGPFGALVLLWSRPLSILACLGALIMILILGVEAAVQSSTSQPLRSQFQLSNAAASIPIATTYDSYWPSGHSDPLLIAALHAGVSSARNITTREMVDWPLGFSGKPTAIAPFCNTGNCTFEPYASLAVEHRCSNITEAVRYDRNHQVATLSVYPTTAPPIYANNQSSWYANITLTGQLASTQVNMTCATRWSEPSWNATDFQLEFLSLAEVYFLIIDSSMKHPQNTFEAFRCNFDFGMQLYTASVNQGRFVEIPGDFIQGNWTFHPNDNITWNGNENVYDTSHWSLKTVASSGEYEVKVKYSTWAAVTGYLPNYLTNAFSAGKYYNADDLLTTLYDNIHWDMGIETPFETIAQSLTTYFRTASGEAAIGTAINQQQYIHVFWPWLIGPLVVVLLNFIFVLAVRAQTRRLGLPGWRNDALAFMVGGQIADEVDTGIPGNYVLIGPPGSINGVSALNKWAATRLAILKSSEQAKQC